MTRDDVNVRVQIIRAMSRDDEAAHVAQDQLYVDVLRAIAIDPAGASELAAAALAVEDIDFSRWYA